MPFLVAPRLFLSVSLFLAYQTRPNLMFPCIQTLSNAFHAFGPYALLITYYPTSATYNMVRNKCLSWWHHDYFSLFLCSWHTKPGLTSCSLASRHLAMHSMHLGPMRF